MSLVGVSALTSLDCFDTARLCLVNVEAAAAAAAVTDAPVFLPTICTLLIIIVNSADTR